MQGYAVFASDCWILKFGSIIKQNIFAWGNIKQGLPLFKAQILDVTFGQF
jgi:hypothetical protein